MNGAVTIYDHLRERISYSILIKQHINKLINIIFVIESRVVSSAAGVPPPSATTVSDICAKLGSYRLLLTEHGRRDLNQRVRLNVSTDDVTYALKDDKLSMAES